MTSVLLQTRSPALGALVTTALEGEGLSVTHRVVESVRSAAVRQKSGDNSDALSALRARLHPFELGDACAQEGDFDLEVDLGGPDDLDDYDVRLSSNNPALLQAALQGLRGAGVSAASTCLPYAPKSSFKVGAASAFACQALAFVLRQHGGEVAPPERTRSATGRGVVIALRDAAFAALPARTRYGVQLWTDAPELAAPLRDHLQDAGFRCTWRSLEGAPAEAFELSPGGFDAAVEDLQSLQATLVDQLTHIGVDAVRFPLVEGADKARPPSSSDGPPSLDAKVRLPLAAWQRGDMRPYGGGGPDTFAVTIRTDEPARVEPLRRQLQDLGFSSISVELRPAHDVPWRVTCDALRRSQGLYQHVLNAVRGFASSVADDAAIPVEERRRSRDRRSVILDCPLSGLTDGGRARRILQSASHYKVTVLYDSTAPTRLIGALTDAGVAVNARAGRSTSFVALHHGGAPDAVCAHVCDIVAPFLTAPSVERIEAWDEDDRDLYLYVSEGSLKADASPAPINQGREADRDLSAWVGDGTPKTSALLPFLTDHGDHITLAGIELPKSATPDHPLVPARDRFAHFVLDQSTAETLVFLAQSVALGESASLEGPTSTSKSSTVLYLAALCRQPVHRVNLHGTTDAADLFGRWVPNDAANGGAWRWQDGAVTEAAREGHWLCLDEVNLAEPQAIEAMNSLVDRDPHLASPRDHTVVSVDPGFRIFSTMNLGYAGRSPMSPAWRNRWRAARVIPTPSEFDLLQLLRAGVFGEPPVVEIATQRWLCPVSTPAWPRLARAPGMSGYIESLARFHVCLEKALESDDSFGRRRERQVVTRRDILSVLDLLQRLGPTLPHMRQALARYYVDKFGPAERSTVLALLDAAGIGPRTWSLQLSLDIPVRT